MKYKIEEARDKIIIKDIEHFNPKHIFECGQAFRWEREEDGSYTTVAYGRVLNVKKEGEDIIFYPTNRQDFEDVWYDYFDLGTDYGKIKTELREDPVLKEAIEHGYGIRILNQEPFETIISFIISANNQIGRIKKSVEIIAREYGELIGELDGKEYYRFPTAEELSKVDVKELRAISKIGFRDERVVESSKMIYEGEIHIEEIFSMDKVEGQKELMKLPGVGPKVSDCALLFAFKKGDAFPVDVWVKRIMEHFYLKEETPVSKIGKAGDDYFGKLAGYAQQYLFYYAREQDIGK